MCFYIRISLLVFVSIQTTFWLLYSLIAFTLIWTEQFIPLSMIISYKLVPVLFTFIFLGCCIRSTSTCPRDWTQNCQGPNCFNQQFNPHDHVSLEQFNGGIFKCPFFLNRKLPDAIHLYSVSTEVVVRVQYEYWFFFSRIILQCCSIYLWPPFSIDKLSIMPVLHVSHRATYFRCSYALGVTGLDLLLTISYNCIEWNLYNSQACILPKGTWFRRYIQRV